MVTDYDTLEGTVRNTYASVVWSHKIQEKQADIYSAQYNRMEIAKIISASLTSVGIVSLIFTDQFWLKLLSAFISFVSVFVSSFFKSFDLQSMISNHKNAANKLLSVRNDLCVLLLKIRLKGNTVPELLEQYENIESRLNDIYKEVPSTTDKAVKRARKALEINEDNTFSDLEIDEYLPTELRREINE